MTAFEYEIVVKYDDLQRGLRKWRWSIQLHGKYVDAGRCFTKRGVRGAAREAVEGEYRDRTHYLASRRTYDPTGSWDW